jgi:hypothetical protein
VVNEVHGVIVRKLGTQISSLILSADRMLFSAGPHG